MRSAAVSVVVLVLLMVPLPATSQNLPDEPIRVLEDPAGDYYAALRDGPGIEDPVPYYTFQDMEWLDILETADGFQFTIKVVDIEGPLDDTIGFSDGGFFWIHFRHADWDYRLEIERPSGQLEIEYFAVLQSRFIDADEWGFLWRDDERVTFDLSTQTITTFLARDEIPDSRGAAPYPGRSLTDWWVLASQRSSRAEADFNGQTLQFPWELQDRMPDAGIGESSVPVRFGLEQSGHAFLRSDSPYRASNGEATTFLYTVIARNDGPAEDLFTLEAVGAPSAWTVDLPLTGVRLGPGENLSIPVLVTTPFNHKHGGTDSLVLEMRSTTDTTSVGRVELGVRYLTIPQPAGHHDTVVLHSIANTDTISFNSAFAALFQPSGSMYFNTLTDDESSDGVAVTAFAGLGSADFTWLIPLDPTLRMGMDWDLDRTGEAQFTIASPLPVEDAALTGEFLLVPAGSGNDGFEQGTKLAGFADAGVSLGLGGSQTFTLEITPEAAADYIAYHPANELWLRIELAGTGISLFNQNTVPAIEPGGTFRLPLIDYEDDISDAFDALSGAVMSPLTPAIRDANPGDVILFDIGMTARDAATGDYALSLTGQGVEWAQIITPASVALGSESRTATVMVMVPETALGHERADLFLQAEHTSDPQRRGLIRLVVDVDTDVEHDDDSARAAGAIDGGEEESQVPWFVLPAALLVALARRRA